MTIREILEKMVEGLTAGMVNPELVFEGENHIWAEERIREYFKESE